MIERMEGYLVQIREQGARRFTHDIVSVEDLLTKDPNGVPYFELFINEGVNFDRQLEAEFSKYPEIIVAYLKNGKYMFNFDIPEDVLFQEYEGKTILSHMKDFKQLSYVSFDRIVNHPEIVDILIEFEDYYKLGKLNQSVIEGLFTLEPDGSFKIEKYVHNKSAFEELVESTSNPLIIGICKKHGENRLLGKVHQDLLMKKNGDGVYYLDQLMGEGIKINKLDYLPDDKEFIKFLYDKEMFSYLCKCREEHLLTVLQGEQTLLEDLIDKELITKLDGQVYDGQIIQILLKRNKLDLIDGVSSFIYNKPTCEILPEYERDTRPLYQFLLENGVKSVFGSFEDKSMDIITYLYKNGYYDQLESGTAKHFMDEVEPGVLLIDVIIDNNVPINVGYGEFSNELLNHILEKKKYDYLLKFSNKQLNTLANNGSTFFENILDAVASREFNFSLNERIDREYNYDLQAELYISAAKKGLLTYLDRMTDDKLLTDRNGKKLIERLLDVDQEVAVSMIHRTALTNMEIAFILQERGIETPGYDTPLIEEKGYNLEYLNKEEGSLGIGPLLSEGDMLLNKLYELFLNDGKSDKELVTALIAGYREALLVNYDITVSELRNFVKVKEENVDKFFYLVSDNGAFFRRADGCVHCDDKVISTLLHETGHALHHYLSDMKIPDDYAATLKHARDNVVNIEEVEAFAEKYHEIRDSIREDVNARYQSYFEHYYNDEKRAEIEKFLNESKESKREEYKKLGVSDKAIDAIMARAFTVEEYIEHQKRVFIEEYTDAILRTEHNVMMVTGDILDAIYGGELHSRELRNAYGDKIKGTCGHGIAYYGSYSHGFDEMVANFGTLLKSRTADQDLRYLKNLVGEEVFTMISDFYYTNISKSEAFDLGESVKL